MAHDPKEKLVPKYERNGWPAQVRPDVKLPDGWSIELLAGLTRPRAHVVSPDGSQIAFYWDKADASDLYVMSADGGWPARLTFNRDPVGYWADQPPRWSPDGKWLAYTDKSHVWVIPTTGGTPKKVTHYGEGDSPVWFPDSQRLLVNVARDDLMRIVMTTREGGWPQQVTNGPGHDHSANLSRDGQHVAYVHQPLDDFNRSDVMLINLETGDTQALTATPGFHNKQPFFAPDGRSVAYTSERPGFYELFICDLITGEEYQLTRFNHDIAEYCWSPDGSQILCSVVRDAAYQLSLLTVDTGEIQELDARAGVHTNLRWLPDGRSVTYEYEDPITPPDIYRLDFESGSQMQLTFSMPPVFGQAGLVTPEHITYASLDGLEIPAILYRPHKPNGAAVVYPHGGPTSQYELEWDVTAQYFVAKGYTWLAPNFRGSTGYGIDFERGNHGVWGVKDTEDCLAAADYLAGVHEIDRDRIAIFGASYGSYMATGALAIDSEYRFACGVAKYGDCNILTSWAQGDREGREDLERMMKHPAMDRAGYHAGSPVWRVQEIQKPLLIAHGLKDDRVHPLQSEELVEMLKRYDKRFEYVTYAKEGHGLQQRVNKIDFYTRLERFFDWYLL